VALVGIVVLAGLAFENWTFGFERIVELRLKPVSAASLGVVKAEAKLKDLEQARSNAATGDAKRRDELRHDLKNLEASIQAENENHLKTLTEIRKTCAIVREKCANQQQDKEKLEHQKKLKKLEEQRDDLRDQVKKLVNSDRGDTKKIEADITAASRE